MKRICKLTNLAAALALALMLFAEPARADDIAFRHVTVVDVVAGRLVRDQVVWVARSRIVDIVPAAGAWVIGSAAGHPSTRWTSSDRFSTRIIDGIPR